MKMIQKISFFALAILIIGCENYLGFVNDFNLPPTIEVENGGSWVQDLNTGIKMPTAIKSDRPDSIQIEVRVFDPEGQPDRLSASLLTGSGKFYKNGVQINPGDITYNEQGLATVVYKPDSAQFGTHTIEFVIRDNIGNRSVGTVNIQVIDNLPPVADFTITLLGINGPREYLLDARASFDADEDWGGGIVALRWNINGQAFEDKLLDDEGNFEGALTTRFNFPTGGSYEIKLRVVDNDGAVSPEVSSVRNIQ